MVKRTLILLLLVSSSVVAEERKCAVRQADGTLEIRYIDVAEARRTKDVLQRFLDREEGDRRQEVERCIETWREFSASDAREADAATPR